MRSADWARCRRSADAGRMAAPDLIVPIFPLPDVTFFPHTLLPLHVFEARYRAMVLDALERDRRLCVVKLRPGYEETYAGKPAVHVVAGAGEIVSWERLATGRYNILLKGDGRGRLALELLALLLAAGAADARQWSWLGVRIRDLSEAEMDEIAARHGIREGFGVVIVDVIDGTPAAKAGMHNGDIVVALDGRPVTETRLLQRLIAAASPDQDVRLTVLRPDGRRLLPVRLTVMPRPVAGERVAAEFG